MLPSRRRTVRTARDYGFTVLIIYDLVVFKRAYSEPWRFVARPLAAYSLVRWAFYEYIFWKTIYFTHLTIVSYSLYLNCLLLMVWFIYF